MPHARNHPATAGSLAMRTVVGGSAAAISLKLGANESAGAMVNGSELTLPSARPEGPRHRVLSLLLAASKRVKNHALLASCNDEASKGKIACSKRHAPNMTHGLMQYQSSRMVVTLRDGPVPLLHCAWLRPVAKFYGDGELLRLGCGSENWVAIDAIRRGRLYATLSVTLQFSGQDGLRATLPFVMEAFDGLPPPVAISACVDVAYYEGINEIDFHMWAISMQLMGFERLYVPLQRRYHHQYTPTMRSRALRRGLVVFGHDMTHRYVTGTGEQHRVEAETSFDEVITNINADVAICLHERWYDEWVFMSMSPDEFFTFVGGSPTMMPKLPTKPTPFISEYIDRYQDKLSPERHTTLPLDALGRRWPCQSAACISVRLYAEPNLTENWSYEPPNLNASRRPHKRAGLVERNVSHIAKTPLSIEARTSRNWKEPPHGASRKCWYHPDWRAMEPSLPIRIHGYIPDGCARDNWLAASKACSLASQPELRSICWELCGVWGSKTRGGPVPPTPPNGKHVGACGASAAQRNLRFEIKKAILYHGPPSAHMPACPLPYPPSSTHDKCDGPLLERAHMRGGREGQPATWLSGTGPTIRAQLAAAVAAQTGTAGL